ncbi:DoxX family protein [Vibrio sp. dhg]|uniref:DoxX family protein n=1 Tax=Vibrio sp. dhg TaxID=2163016 RepID=UPI000E52B1D8|nr:DoxX family protein [Vibrio sp. dhg]AXT73527.1 DoxX family protein [Vibrio sp. dhg]
MGELLNFIDRILAKPDLGKLVLRVSFAFLFLLHGVHKVIGGTEFIQGLLVDHGLPAFVAYGVYLGEVAAPILMIIGLYTRLASVVVAGTCLMVIYLLNMGDLFALNKFGAWAVEGIGVYLFASIAIMFLGSGKYALKPDAQ